MAEKATNSQNGGKDQSLHVKEKQPIVTDDELDSILDGRPVLFFLHTSIWSCESYLAQDSTEPILAV